MEAQTPLARWPVLKTVCAERPWGFNSLRFRHFRLTRLWALRMGGARAGSLCSRGHFYLRASGHTNARAH